MKIGGVGEGKRSGASLYIFRLAGAPCRVWKRGCWHWPISSMAIVKLGMHSQWTYLCKKFRGNGDVVELSLD
jgi:hypothetical protein